MEKDMNTSGKVLVGFVFGALLGTMTGLLVAPHTGRTMRKNIGKRSKKLAKQLKSYIGKAEAVQKNVHRKNGKATVTAS